MRFSIVAMRVFADELRPLKWQSAYMIVGAHRKSQMLGKHLAGILTVHHVVELWKGMFSAAVYIQLS